MVANCNVSHFLKKVFLSGQERCLVNLEAEDLKFSLIFIELVAHRQQ